jgi:hypothetical protein
MVILELYSTTGAVAAPFHSIKTLFRSIGHTAIGDTSWAAIFPTRPTFLYGSEGGKLGSGFWNEVL